MLTIVYILLGIVAFFLLVITLWLCSMRRNMPWQNCLAALSNLKIKLPPFLRRFALSGPRDYSSLPDPLVMADGTAVTTPEAFDKRREEILSLFEHYVYGTLPRSGFTTAFQVEEEGDALEGTALRRQVKITVTTSKGSSDARLLMYLPRKAEPVPVVLGLNFRGNHCCLEDEAILPSFATDTARDDWKTKRGSAAERWNIADSIARGYAVATIYSADLAPDSRENFASRIIGIFDESEFKAVGAWAFGLMRGIDYLLTESAVDSSRIALVGHSRLGKAAVWAGANDSRAALVISNDSGNTGASLSRGNHGETVYTINMAFPHWFASSYAAYGKHESELPVDQHMLLSAIAPRQLYVASAEDDLWADPQGALNSLHKAKAVFSLYGKQVLPDACPATGTALHCESMGIHVRPGWHDINAQDWKFYLQYMDRYFVKEEYHGAE